MTLRTVLTKVLSPSGPATKIADSLGMSFNTMAVDLGKPDGLVKMLDYVNEKTKGLSKTAKASDIVEMFGGIRGGVGMVELTQGADKVQQKYVQIEGTLSGFWKKFADYLKTPAAQVKLFVSALQKPRHAGRH